LLARLYLNAHVYSCDDFGDEDIMASLNKKNRASLMDTRFFC